MFFIFFKREGNQIIFSGPGKEKVKTKQNKNTMTTSEYLCFVILENNSQESRRMMIKMRNIENGKRERNERARYRLAGGAAITCQKTRGLLNLWGVSFRVLWSGEALNLHWTPSLWWNLPSPTHAAQAPKKHCLIPPLSPPSVSVSMFSSCLMCRLWQK